MKHAMTGGMLLMLAALAGCASKGEQPKVTIDRDPEEYVTVKPTTGSNIPKRMKVKDIISADGTKKSQTEEMDPETFRKALRPGKQLDPSR